MTDLVRLLLQSPISYGRGDAPPTEITEEAFDRIVAVNLRVCVMAVKHVLPVMRGTEDGASFSPSRRSRLTKIILMSPTRQPRRG